MARYDGNTPNKSGPHHRKMKSGRKGKGGDRKLKAMKRVIAENSGAPPGEEEEETWRDHG